MSRQGAASWLLIHTSLMLTAGCVLDRSGAQSAGGGGVGGEGGAGGATACVPSQCPSDDPCQTPICLDDACATELAPAGTLCDAATNMICNAAGACIDPLGFPCEIDPAVCPTGTFCASGVCCNALCDGACESCNLSNMAGYCNPFAAGINPNNVCTAGVCDGGGDCADGADRWHHMVGDGFGQWFSDAAAGDDGAAYFVGSFTVSLAMPGIAPITNAGAPSGVLTRVLPDGNAEWAVQFDFINGEVDGVSVHGGDVFVTGWYDGAAVTVQGVPYNAVSTGTDIFIAKFNTAGALQWLKTFGGTNYEYAVRLAADDAGNVVMAGYTAGDITFGSTPHFNLGGRDAFVVKLNNAGDVVWSHWFGGAGDQSIWDIDVNSVGDVAVAGEMNATFDPGKGGLNYVGGIDSWVARLTAAGDLDWARGYGGPDDDVAYVARFTESGNTVAFGGFFTSSINIGAGQFTTDSGKRDGFMAFLGSGGTFASGFQLGEPNKSEELWEAERTTNGGWVLGGSYENTWTIGDITFPDGGGGLEAFVLKLGSEMTPLWGYAIAPNGGDDRLWGLAVDSANNVILAAAPVGTFNWFSEPQMHSGGTEIFIASLTP